MKYCEQCREKAGFPRNNGYPYVGFGYGKCEICRMHTQVHEVDKRHVVKTGTPDEKTVDEMHQILYRNLAEELAVYHNYGPKTGQINEHLTSELKKIKVDVDGKTDWKTTYELRQIARDRIQLEELRKRAKS